MDYSKMVDAEDKVEATFGFDSDLIPPGWYWVKIDGAEVRADEGRVPNVNISCVVLAGPHEGRKVFDGFSLVAGETKRDKAGNEIARTAEEIAKANQSVQGMLNGWLSAIKVHKNKQPSAPPSSTDFLAQFYNVGAWEGREVMVKFGHRKYKGRDGDQRVAGRFQQYAALEDPKHGLAAWQAGGGAAKGGGAVKSGAGTQPVTL